MARGLSSLRIERLNTLLRILRSNKYISRVELMTECSYVSGRTLESDLHFLRKVFGMKLHYSRSMNGYFLEDAGKYVLDERNGDLNV